MFIKIYSPAVTKRKNSIGWKVIIFGVLCFLKWILCNTKYTWGWGEVGLENTLKINHWGGWNKRRRGKRRGTGKYKTLYFEEQLPNFFSITFKDKSRCSSELRFSYEPFTPKTCFSAIFNFLKQNLTSRILNVLLKIKLYDLI